MYGPAAAVLVLIILAVLIFLKYCKRKMGAFRAEVAIETLRLWRKMVEDYRRTQPTDSMSKSMNVVPSKTCGLFACVPTKHPVERLRRPAVANSHIETQPADRHASR